MKMKRIVLCCLISIFVKYSFSQEKCGTELYTLQLMQKYPEYNDARSKVNVETIKWLKKIKIT